MYMSESHFSLSADFFFLCIGTFHWGTVGGGGGCKPTQFYYIQVKN